MPREARHITPGVAYHLISRFVDRELFIKTEDERRYYIALLGNALARSDWRCLAFAIMSNHIHIAVIAGADTLDSWIRRVHSPFADAMNRAYDRIGPMFVRGPKALRITTSAVGNVIAYIHNNPVRAKVVTRASGTTWTSHGVYLGLTPALPCRRGWRSPRAAAPSDLAAGVTAEITYVDCGFSKMMGIPSGLE